MQRDQCRRSFTGIKMNFFLNILIFFLAVQEDTAAGPSLTNFEKNCVVKKCTSVFLASSSISLSGNKNQGCDGACVNISI